MYILDVFDGGSDEVVTETGRLVAHTLGLDTPPEMAGRRWIADLTATAWRIIVPHIAARERTRRAA